MNRRRVMPILAELTVMRHGAVNDKGLAEQHNTFGEMPSSTSRQSVEKPVKLIG
jgi:hypothetical protein